MQTCLPVDMFKKVLKEYSTEKAYLLKLEQDPFFLSKDFQSGNYSIPFGFERNGADYRIFGLYDMDVPRPNKGSAKTKTNGARGRQIFPRSAFWGFMKWWVDNWNEGANVNDNGYVGTFRLKTVANEDEVRGQNFPETTVELTWFLASPMAGWISKLENKWKQEAPNKKTKQPWKVNDFCQAGNNPDGLIGTLNYVGFECARLNSWAVRHAVKSNKDHFKKKVPEEKIFDLSKVWKMYVRESVLHTFVSIRKMRLISIF